MRVKSQSTYGGGLNPIQSGRMSATMSPCGRMRTVVSLAVHVSSGSSNSVT